MANKPPFPPDQLPVPVELVERRIYLIRGQKVMLDSDLAELYQVETRALIQAVKRNIDRFPEDFTFQLTQEEAESLRSQIVISNASRGGRRYLPYAFTEHGALMLSSVLKSKRAVQMSIRVVRVFIGLREMLATHKDLATRMEKLEAGQKGHASILSVIVEEIKRLKQRPEPPPKRRIGFHIPDKTINPPPGWAESETMARLRDPAPGVRYLGYVAEGDLPGLFAGATAFVYPSLYEGFGFPVAQAMAAGTPVITSCVSALPEIAGGAAKLIDPRSEAALRDALEEMLTSPSRRGKSIELGRANARRFSWQECARKSLQFFEEVVG